MDQKSRIIEKIELEQQVLKKQKFAIVARNFLRHLFGISGLIRRDNRLSVDLSLQHCIRAWKHGFTRFNYSIYGLSQAGKPTDYLSDYNSIKQLRINGRFAEVVDSKLMFSLLMKYNGMPTPEIKAVISKGLIHLLRSESTLEPSTFLKESIPYGERIVIKPIWGWHGTGIIVVTHSHNGYQINGEDICLDDLTNIMSRLDNYLVTEYARQGEYGTQLFPDTTNTIRIVTFCDIDTKKAFIAKAVQRIGTSRSFPVDNFKAGRGGLSSLIDVNNGELGLGALVDKRGHVTWHSNHPESYASIQGVLVPSWLEIRRSILNYANRFLFAPCIAWDIVPTQSGFTILEGNSMPGMPVIQVHGPILTDPRIRRFYEHYDIIN